MLQVLKDFFSSEKGVFAYLAPLVIATVFVFTGRVTEQEWMEFALYLAGIYTTGKTVQGSAKVIANGKASSDAQQVDAVKEGLEVLKAMLAQNDFKADDALKEKFEEPKVKE